MSQRFDALVIGGGPAGSTAALVLARAGWRIAVVEKDDFPRQKVCGGFVSPVTLMLLRTLGLHDVLEAGGPAIRRVGLFAGEAAAYGDMPRYEGAFGRAFSRERCDTRLLAHARAAGADVLQPARVTAVRGEPGQYECEVTTASGARVLEARCVIAAHGSWERGPLPTHAQRDTARAGDLFGFETSWADVALDTDLLPLLMFPGGYAGLVHTGDGRVTLSCCVRRDALALYRARHGGLCAGDALVAALRDTNVAARHALAQARRVAPWLGCGPLRPGMRTRGESGIHAVGNAAGEAHPLVGEGVSMAIQSSVLLCATLLDGADGEVYERRWRRLFAGRLFASACYAQLALRPALATAYVRLAARVPAIVTCPARWSGKARGVMNLIGSTALATPYESRVSSTPTR